jgi:hypothetical protein
MSDRSLALVRLNASRAAGWSDPQSSLDDVEIALGMRPTTRAPHDRAATVWIVTDRDTGLPHEHVMAVEAALQEIQDRLP